MPRYQSAYRQNHSTETALLKIRNHALLAAHRSLVVLLDMSALCSLRHCVSREIVRYTELAVRSRLLLL